jgi:hypothetical protein
MKRRVNRAREYQHAIRKVLLDEWDPIGVADVPEAQDEYDSYIHSIYALLIHHEGERKLFDYLWDIETKDMELYGNRIRTEKVVNSLLRLRQEMDKKR